MILREITCKSILSKSNIPDVEYSINPYIGCGHGCVYCYATFMKRFTNHAEPWGQFVDVKVNGPDRLRNDLRHARSGEVLLSSVTDPYQPVEKQYKVTRACLEVLQQIRLPVSILTKSVLVLRDLDLLKQMKTVDVGFTITTLDEKIRTLFEPQSSSVEERFKAIRALSDVGIQTWIFFGPVLPYFSDNEEAIDDLLHRAGECGADYVYVDRMNFYPEVWKGVEALLQTHKPLALPYYQRAIKMKKNYSAFLRARVQTVSKRHAIGCRILF